MYYWYINGHWHWDFVMARPRSPHRWGFEITLRHTTFGMTPLDEWSARRRYLYPTTHNTHKRQTSMSTAGFEPVISARERPLTHALIARPLGSAGIGSYSLLILPVLQTRCRLLICNYGIGSWQAVCCTLYRNYTNYVRHTTCAFSVTLYSSKKV